WAGWRSRDLLNRRREAYLPNTFFLGWREFGVKLFSQTKNLLIHFNQKRGKPKIPKKPSIPNQEPHS
ncbi:MAG: hypothetical protein ABIE14_03790, partial [Patescibacteria group bacterium]